MNLSDYIRASGTSISESRDLGFLWTNVLSARERRQLQHLPIRNMSCLRCKLVPRNQRTARLNWRRPDDGTVMVWRNRAFDPSDAVWIHRTTSAASSYPPTLRWVEVVRCGTDARPQTMLSPRAPARSLWSYIAPGSGVRVRVGRSVVLDEGNFTEAHSANELSVAIDGFWDLQDRFGHWLRNKLAVDTRNVDSILRVNHHEPASAAPMDELVLAPHQFVGPPDAAALQRAVDQGVPWLHRRSAAAVQRLAEACASRPATQGAVIRSARQFCGCSAHL